MVYVYFGTYGLLCYDHHGTQVCERRIDPPASQYGMSVSPILYNDKIILVWDDNNRNSRLLAMDWDTGATVWEHNPEPCFRPAGQARLGSMWWLVERGITEQGRGAMGREE